MPELDPLLAERIEALYPSISPSELSLDEVADPDRVVAQLERFAEKAMRDPALLAFSFDEHRHTEMLITLLAGSAFVADILVREPALFRSFASDITDARMRLRPSERTAAEMERALGVALENVTGYEEQKLAMRRFHRHALFRIAASDLLGFWDMPLVTSQLSMLSGSIIRAALDVAGEAAGVVPAGFTVVGMGKLGGMELNYSSDIDLLFVAGSDARRYGRLGERLIDTLGGITVEGFLYRVDMRLRPWGRAGSLVQTVDAYEKYLRKHGEPWEKQALLKARILAGNTAVGQDFLDRIWPHVFSSTVDESRGDILTMKRRIESDLQRKGQLWGNVKQGRGSIRDIEFAVQFLQMRYGLDAPEIRTQSTRSALIALSKADLISEDYFRTLNEGYTFHRVLEHHLQLYHNRQTHTIPRDPVELDMLARRLEFSGPDPGQQLIRQYEDHAVAIRTVFDELLAATDKSNTDAPVVQPHVARMTANYRDAFSEEEIARHVILANRISSRHPITIETSKICTNRWRLTIVGYDYLGSLSVISGLLVAYGFDIIDGRIFTYERLPTDHRDLGRKIVDAFTVRAVENDIEDGTWTAYAEELTALTKLLARGLYQKAQGKLAERIADASTPTSPTEIPALYPVDIEIDNDVDAHYSVLHIEAPNTIGFLYELTNALAILDIHIAQVNVTSSGERVLDSLHVTHLRRGKIILPEAQAQLRVATVLVQHFTHLLPHAPNPSAALKQFRILLGDLLKKRDWTSEIASLERPEVLDALARLLGVSDFLWNDFLRMQHANLFPLVQNIESLENPRTREAISADLTRAMKSAPDAKGRVEALNAIKDQEMFRIDMRHILGYTGEFDDFARELTSLAEAVVTLALHDSMRSVEAVAGQPMFEDETPCPISVCALGKFGGREMGFASDIELLFVYEASGRSSGPTRLTNAQYFDRVAREFQSMIQSKRDGVFEVDLRLRPYGASSSLSTSLAAFRRYFSPDGAAWPYERQLLVKLRPVAGDPELGNLIVEVRDEILTGIGVFDVASMRAMRERQLRHLVKPGTLNAKYSPGGLVDIEYLTQGLQVSYCNRHVDLIAHRDTRGALTALARHGYVSAEDHEALDGAFVLLRQVIDGLRMVRGNAKDLTIPSADSQDMLYLSRRLSGIRTTDLSSELLERMAQVAEISKKLLA